jgi:hypothetical protein
MLKACMSMLQRIKQAFAGRHTLKCSEPLLLMPLTHHALHSLLDRCHQHGASPVHTTHCCPSGSLHSVDSLDTAVRNTIHTTLRALLRSCECSSHLTHWRCPECIIPWAEHVVITRMHVTAAAGRAGPARPVDHPLHPFPAMRLAPAPGLKCSLLLLLLLLLPVVHRHVLGHLLAVLDNLLRRALGQAPAEEGNAVGDPGGLCLSAATLDLVVIILICTVVS